MMTDEEVGCRERAAQSANRELRSTAGKVLVVCLDGATLDLLQPWMEAGRLPTLARFKRDGVSGPLQSVIPPITAPAWASFMTGKNPGKHGVYHFINRGPQSSQQAFVSAASRTGQTLWDLLGQYGKRVLVLNVPTTYPPSPVNGVLIADFLTPPGRRDFTYPPSVLDDIEAQFGKYPLHLKTLMFSANLSGPNTERLLREVRHELKYKFDVAHYLLDRYDSDFTILHILGTDRVQHELWNLLDPSHPMYDTKLAVRYGEAILDYFAQVDQEIARLEARFNDDVTTFIISDHGFGPVHRAIDLNVWLLEKGYIQIKPHAASRFKYWLWRMGLTNELVVRVLLKTFFKYGAGLVERMSDETLFKSVRFFAQRGQNNPLFSLEDVDWSRTKAYAFVGMGAININLKGREPTGSVEPADYQSVKQEITAELKQLYDKAKAQPVQGHVFLREEIYHGPYTEQAPDIMYLPNEAGYVAGSMMGFTANRAIIDAPAWPGHHRMNGLLLAKGMCLKQGASVNGAALIDLAPTILYLMGCPIPRDMDGRVLVEMIEDSVVASRAPAYQEPASLAQPPAPLSSDEDQQVVERLRELGYLL